MSESAEAALSVEVDINGAVNATVELHGEDAISVLEIEEIQELVEDSRDSDLDVGELTIEVAEPSVSTGAAAATNLSKCSDKEYKTSGRKWAGGEGLVPHQ